MFMHSQRLRAALRTMRHYGGRVLIAVPAVVAALALVVATTLTGLSGGQGGKGHGDVAISHDVAQTGSRVPGQDGGAGRKGKDQPGQVPPQDSDAPDVTVFDPAEDGGKRSRADPDDDDA